jgi:GTP-binding protein YchF
MERVGILGLPQSGKTTVFEILVQGAGAQAATTSGREQVAVIVVPDERVDRLAALFQPKKTTRASIQFVDTVAAGQASARVAAKGPDLFSGVRNCDALLAVVRDFDNPAVPAERGVDPARDLRALDSELILNDLAIVESRLEKLAKELRVGRKEGEREHVLLTRLKSALEAERPLRGETLDAEELKLMRGFQFLTRKPLLVVVNQGEGDRPALPDAGADTLVVGLKALLEREVVGLAVAERDAFRSELGIGEDGLSLVIRACYRLLGLISFFTVGPDEVRAWTLHDGDRALDAAGAIHSDLAKGFIRAEVTPCDRLLEAGGESQAKERNWSRLEGRDYRVVDGDCIEIRFNK